MQSERIRRAARRGAALLLAALVPALGGCSDSTGSEPAEKLVVVLNSVGISLTLIPTGRTDVRTVGLAPDGTPTTLAVRGRWAVVPMGIANSVVVVDLQNPTAPRAIALPAGSGATGVAFANDSIAVVGNPGLNSVSPVNVLRGTVGAQIPVGTYPQALAADGQRVYVLNANLVNFTPAGPGSVTVLSAATLAVQGTVALTGLNPGSAEIRNGQLFVLNSGTWGGNNSSVSVVDVATRTELRRVDGFGNFPGSLTTQAGRNVFVATYDTGVLVYDPDADAMVRGLANPLVPAGILPVSVARLDELGLLYTLHPGDCTAPGTLVQMGASGNVLAQVGVGVCPFAIGFGEVAAQQ